MGEWKALKREAGTGWKELERESGTGWKALEWEGVPIDVGGACINRASDTGILSTYIDKNNSANAAGTLTNVCVYMSQVVSTNVYVGIFYVISGNTLKCRSAANLGHLSVGANNKVVSLAIQIGDWIGVYGGTNSNRIERTADAGGGYWYHSGNCCVVDNETTYSFTSPRTLSLYGTS